MTASLPSWSERMLQLLRRMNNFYLPGSTMNSCLRFEVEGEQVGWVQPKIASILSHFPDVFTSHGGAISVSCSLDSYAKRSEAVDQVLQQLRKDESLTCLIGWRNEKYAVKPRFCDASLMWMERSATSLFGVKRYGVHLNGYSWDESGRICMWLGRRSPTKQTYPGMLDNLAAGGLGANCGVKETMVKECGEEACIPACIAEKARPVSTVSYTYEDHEGVFPESQFVFDLELPLDFKPQIGDGEVQNFYFYPIEEVKELLVSEEFKPNCAMVVLDFLIRHSIIQPDTEPYYQEFLAGLHRTL